MKNKKDPNRNRTKKVNLAGLYAVPHDIAYENGKPRPGVYGYITKDTPYICKARESGSTKPPQLVSDMTGDNVPKVLKNRMLAFWGNKQNSQKKICYLAEKSLYEEMLARNKQSTKGKK